ncbi:hypothetical protein BEK98_29560 [Streptomyces diastatochromogenes]|uniref:Uncharacterized protein n=1 Tax=Streptomyces diastatochromogenes TaxID=42236 RepID=A0A233S6X1_STRDA|nr:hypothetical protein BEK98_29560 [Streptomyces diastatochromogenes]
MSSIQSVPGQPLVAPEPMYQTMLLRSALSGNQYTCPFLGVTQDLLKSPCGMSFSSGRSCRLGGAKLAV